MVFVADIHCGLNFKCSLEKKSVVVLIVSVLYSSDLKCKLQLLVPRQYKIISQRAMRMKTKIQLCQIHSRVDLSPHDRR